MLQVILYTLMLSDCHKLDVPAGLLLYSKTGKLLSVPSLSHELRGEFQRFSPYGDMFVVVLPLLVEGRIGWFMSCPF